MWRSRIAIIADKDALATMPKLDPSSYMRRVNTIRSPNGRLMSRAVEHLLGKYRSSVIDEETMISAHVVMISNAWQSSLTSLNAPHVPQCPLPAILKLSK
jgi:hypothetical protein